MDKSVGYNQYAENQLPPLLELLVSICAKIAEGYAVMVRLIHNQCVSAGAAALLKMALNCTRLKINK